MKTFVFQLEVEMADGQDMEAAVSVVLHAIAADLGALKRPCQDPPFRLTVVDLGMKADK